MKDVLIVKDLIKLLLDYNPYAEVYLNVDGSPIGLSGSDIGFSSGECDDCKERAEEVYFDISRNEHDI